MVEEGGPGEGVAWEDIFMEECTKREDNFHEEVQDFLALLNKKH